MKDRKLNENEYNKIKKLLQDFAAPINTDNTNSLSELLVGTSPNTYAFEFNDENKSCKITMESKKASQIITHNYNCLFTKSYYGEIVAIFLSDSIDSNDYANIKALKTLLNAHGYGMVRLEPKVLIPTINTSLQCSNSNIKTKYWDANIDYENQKLTIIYAESKVYQIDLKYGFYYDDLRNKQPVINASKNTQLARFPYSDLLEVSEDEYQRLDDILKKGDI